MTRRFRAVFTLALATSLGLGSLGCGPQSTSSSGSKGDSEGFKAKYMEGRNKMADMKKKAEEEAKKATEEKTGKEASKEKPAKDKDKK